MWENTSSDYIYSFFCGHIDKLFTGGSSPRQTDGVVTGSPASSQDLNFIVPAV